MDFEKFRERGRAEARSLVRDDLLRGGGGGPLAMLKGGIRGTARQSASSFRTVSRLATQLFSRESALNLPRNAPRDPAARFACAASAYGRDPSYAAGVQDNKYRICILFVALAVGILGIDIATWRSYSSSPLLILGHLAPVLPALANAFVCAFHNWQIRRGRLDSFVAFARAPREWWPIPSAMASANGTSGSVAAIVLAASGITASMIMGTASPADAQVAAAPPSGITANAIFAKLSDGDLWNHMLTFVFPGVGPITGTVGPINNGITEGFAAMIACLMACAAGMMAFQTISAAVHTAHEGEILGKRWHTVWAPIRVVYGMASLVPVVKGYCLLQIVVVWAAVLSGQVGNQIWKGFVSGMTVGTISAPSLPQTVNTVSEIMHLELCHAFLVADAARTKSADKGAGTRVNARAATQAVDTGDAFYDSLMTGMTGAAGAAVNPTTPIDKLAWDYGACGSIRGNYPMGVGGRDGDMVRAQVAGVNALRDELKPVAEALVKSWMPGVGSGADVSQSWKDLVTAKNNYDRGLSAAALAYVNSASANSGLRRTVDDKGTKVAGNTTDDFRKVLTDEGWASAGSAYMTIARLNAKQVELMRAVPTVTAEGKATEEMVAKGAKGGGDIITKFNTWWSENVTSANSGLDTKAINAAVSAMRAGDMHQSDNGVYQGMQYLFSSDGKVQDFLINIVKLDPDKMDGLQQMVNFGDRIIGATEAGLLLYLGVKGGLSLSAAGTLKAAFSGVAGKLSGIASGGMTFGALFFGLIFSSVFFAGVYDSVILPMMPFMHFLFATMGILIVVVEGVIAAPLWAFSHVRMDGQEFADGPQKAGYQIMFNLLFRIPLTLFGLFFSLVVFNAMVWLMGMTLYPALSAGTSESLFGFVGTITMIILVTIINYQIANRSFLLITQIPDRVTRWFGASDHSDESHHTNTAVANISGGARQAVQGAGGAAKGALAGKQTDPNAKVVDAINRLGSGGGGGSTGGRPQTPGSEGRSPG